MGDRAFVRGGWSVWLIVVLALVSGCSQPDDGAQVGNRIEAMPKVEASGQDTLLPSDRTDNPVKAYIVQSYECDNVCGMNQGDGIRRALQAYYGSALDITVHYMNTKTTHRDKAAMQADAIAVLAEIEALQPDLVFTVDDNAFREVGLKLVDQPFPVVFTGMNGQPAAYNQTVTYLDKSGQPSANITGVYEKLHVVASLRVMKDVMPKLRHVAILLDDSPTGKAIRKQLELELASNDSGVSADVHVAESWDDYRTLVQDVAVDDQIDATYNIVLSVRDQTGRSHAAGENFRYYLETCRKPSMALNFGFAKSGLFGGAAVDFQAMGQKAGQMGVAALQNPDDPLSPICQADQVMITFNRARAQMLEIPIPDDLLASAKLYHTMALMADRAEIP